MKKYFICVGRIFHQTIVFMDINHKIEAFLVNVVAFPINFLYNRSLLIGLHSNLVPLYIVALIDQ